MNLKPGLYIDVFEVRLGLRGNGVGRKIITILESVAKDYFKRIYLRAHDENALNFWKHLGYKEDEKEFIQFKFL